MRSVCMLCGKTMLLLALVLLVEEDADACQKGGKNGKQNNPGQYYAPPYAMMDPQTARALSMQMEAMQRQMTAMQMMLQQSGGGQNFAQNGKGKGMMMQQRGKGMQENERANAQLQNGKAGQGKAKAQATQQGKGKGKGKGK